jgi:hypothetical protein
MRRVRVHFENIPGSPYSQSGMIDTPKLDRESHEDFDIRTVLDHCTVNGKGEVCIPSMAFKQCLDSAAYKLGMKVPGRRGSTFKNFFASGVICDADVPISNGKPLTPKDAVIQKIPAHADGKRGSGSRVPRRFPQWDRYSGIAEFTVIDPIITENVFETHFKSAGMIVGIGRFRPENGGSNGRFRATKFEWENFEL